MTGEIEEPSTSAERDSDGLLRAPPDFVEERSAGHVGLRVLCRHYEEEGGITNKNPDTEDVPIALPDLMTARELEALLRIDVKTIYNYVQRGLIPYVRIQSNVRFPKQQIDEWIKRQSYDPHGMQEREQGRSPLRRLRRTTRR